jgi:hypothetical protein
MALTGALCCVVHAVTGFTNKSLRGLVAGLLGVDYSTNQMSYDLRRLRLHGLIERIPGTITYQLTTDGTRTAVFYTKVRDRLLGPLLDAADYHPAPSSSAAPSNRWTTPSATHARLGTAASTLVTNSGAPPPRDLGTPGWLRCRPHRAVVLVASSGSADALGAVRGVT